jgi:hypothetical protein
MLGNVKEFIVMQSEADTDIFPEISEGRDISALELKTDKDCTVEVNGEEFEVSAGEVLSFPYNYMKIHTLKFMTAGVKVKIRYLAE